jgi:7,8-dihydropterin-6-yl-methyl-4-(beta-D-ribofuranosyl)aminobenzene 5'-phosphate synthase
MKGLIEIKRLTVINIVDNETDALSSPCCCMKPTPNTPSSTPDDRPCTYTQELNTVIKDEGALDFNYQCHAAHGLSLLLIADYDEIDDNGEVQTKSSQLLFDGGPDPAIWKSNAKKLKIDLPSIGRAVLSHFHVDHSNGLKGAVEDISEARTKIGLDPLIVDIHKSKIVRRGLKVSAINV